MRIVAKISLFAASMVFAAVTGVPALAMVPDSSRASAQTTTTASKPTEAGSQGAAQQAAAQTRLADAKLKACQNREEAINNIFTRLSDRGQKQLDLFSTIAERTEKFYADKGKTLTSYDALVADVAAKKAAAQTAVDAVKSSSTTFKCDGSDPKGAAAGFKENLKSEIEALQAYRTSVKNLIVGVKSVQGSTTSTDNKKPNDATPTTGGN